MKNFLFGCFLVLVIFAVIVCFAGCGVNSTENNVVEDAPSMFVKVESGPYWNVYYHKKNKSDVRHVQS